MSFEEAIEWTGVDKWKWLEPSWKWKGVAKTEWEKMVARSEVARTRGNRVIGYVAITYVYSSLPYCDLDKDAGDISEFLACMINRCIFYETRRLLAGSMFEIEDNLLAKCPKEEVHFQKWVKELYNRTSWWLCFLIFEQHYRKGHHSIVCTRPVMWLIN
jgi:hypothetical protein